MNSTHARSVCGAECGLAVVGTAGLVARHWSTVVGAPTVVTSGPTPMRSPRCFRFNPIASTSYLQHTFTSAIASPSSTVARFYVYFASLPNADMSFFENTSGPGPRFKVSDSKIYASISNSILGGTGVTITAGVMYRIDVRINLTSPTWTVDVQVDGVACGQATSAGSASSTTYYRIGATRDAVTADFYIDDIVVSDTSADYPIGAGTVVGLYPNGDGAHGGTAWAAGAFGKGAGGATAAARTDTNIWQSLQTLLSTTIPSTFVADITGGTTDYVEFTLADMPVDATSINGVEFVFTTHSAAATANSISIQYVDSAAGPNAVIQNGDFSETTIVVVSVTKNSDSNTSPYTVSTINSTKVRFAAGDVNPDVYLDGFCFEVDYIGGPPAQSVALPTAVATLSAGTLDITEGGVSLALPTAVVTLVGGNVSVLVPPIVVALPTATVQLTAGAVSVSAAVSLALPPAVVSLTAGTITSVSGAVSVTLPTAVATLTAGAVSRTAGGVSIPLGTAVTTLTPGTLGVSTAAPPITVALPTAIVNLSAGAVGLVAGPVFQPLGTAVATLTPGTFSIISGPVSRAITPANVILSAGVLNISSSISVPLGTAVVTVTSGVLNISPGATSVVLSPAIAVLSAGTISRSATVSLPLSPAVATLTAGTVSCTTGGISVALSPAVVTLVGGQLNITAQGGPQSRALGTAIAVLSPGVLSVSTGGITRPIGTALVVLTAGTVSRTAQVNRALEAATLTLSPGVLGIVSTKSVALEPAIATLMPGFLDIKIVFGGLPKVWNGVAWVTKPVMVWNGSAWVEKPMKVWNGSSWELA